jgi:hypothetical protein
LKTGNEDEETGVSVWNLPRAGIDLLELKLVLRYDLTSIVEDEEAAAGGALVNGTNESCGGGRHFCRCNFRFAK